MDHTADIAGLNEAIAFVERWYKNTPERPGITSPMPGVLVLDTAKPGPTVVINAMMHLSEPAGLAAHQAVVERWERGDHPAGGKIILTLGHDPEKALQFLERNQQALTEGRPVNYDEGHVEDRVRMEQLRDTVWQKAKGHVLDIHSMPRSGDQPVLIPYRTVQDASTGKVDLKATAASLQPVIAGMKVKHVILDYFGPNDVERSFGPVSALADDARPIVVECGGNNLDPSCRQVARQSAQAWLQNLTGWRAPGPKNTPEHFYYSGCHVQVHPALIDWPDPKRAPDTDDTYYLLSGPNAGRTVSNEEHREMVQLAVDRYEPQENALSNFRYLKAGTPLAIGGQNGCVYPLLHSGYVLFGADHSVSPEQKSSFYLLATADHRYREKELLPEKARGTRLS